jgi:hypothetical protein
MIPPDPTRCQATIRAAHGAFVLGPPPRFERCRNTPVTIAREVAPGPDGEVGAMSLCENCLVQFRKQVGEAGMTFEPVASARETEPRP